MFNKWRKYSYADQKNYLMRARLAAFKMGIVVFTYILLTNVLFPMIVMESASMQPSIERGDRFIFLSFNVRMILPRPVFGEIPFKRGDVVTVNLAVDDESFVSRVADRFVRFFTVGRRGINNDDRFFIKRVIALPGDEISMVNYVMQVRPAGSDYTITEYEQKFYRIDIPQTSSAWDESIPFSGTMTKRVLGAGECFVLSDDRANTNDSRTWGPVPIRSITAKALFCYFPPAHFGRL